MRLFKLSELSVTAVTSNHLNSLEQRVILQDHASLCGALRTHLLTPVVNSNEISITSQTFCVYNL